MTRAHSGDRTRRDVLRTTGVVGSVALAGCFGDVGVAGQDTEEHPIQFAGPQGAAMTIPTRLIRDEGFAEEIESGTFPVISGARLANEGRDVRLVGPVCESFNSIIVREDAGVDDLEDLQDVTLGSMPRTSAPWTHFAVLATLDGHDPDDFDTRFGPPATLFGAIQQGDLDAMIGVEPFSSRLLATGDFEEPYVFTDRWEELTGNPMPLVEVATYQATIDEKPEAVRGLMEAMFDAGEHISDDPRGVIEGYDEELGLETDEEIDLVEERIGDIYPGEFDEELRESGTEVVERAADEGLVEDDPSETMFRRPDVL